MSAIAIMYVTWQWVIAACLGYAIFRYGELKVVLFIFRAGLRFEDFIGVVTMPLVLKKADQISREKQQHGVLVSPTHTNVDLKNMSEEEFRSVRPPIIQIKSANIVEYRDAIGKVQMPYIIGGKDAREGFTNRNKKKAGEFGHVPAEVQDSSTIEAMAKYLVVAWWNIEDENGVEVKATQENIRSLLESDPAFRNFVAEIANDQSQFTNGSEYSTESIGGKSPITLSGKATTLTA